MVEAVAAQPDPSLTRALDGGEAAAEDVTRLDAQLAEGGREEPTARGVVQATAVHAHRRTAPHLDGRCARLTHVAVEDAGSGLT